MQTFELQPGMVAAFLVKTVDEWQGSSGPNVLPEPSLFLVRTLDNTPPHFIDGYPRILRTYNNAAQAAFQLDEAATILFIVLPDILGITPSAAEVFVRAVRPRYQTSVAADGLVTAAAAFTAFTQNITGLQGLTEYTLWAIARDDSGNEMVAPVQVSFETLDDQPPQLQASIGPVAASWATFAVQLDEPGTVIYSAQPVANRSSCPSGLDLRAAAADSSDAYTGSFAVASANTALTRCACIQCAFRLVVMVTQAMNHSSMSECINVYSTVPRVTVKLLAMQSIQHACMACQLPAMPFDCHFMGYRNITTLRDETQYLMCVVAEDTFFNIEGASTAIEFTTADGTPPAITLQAATQVPKDLASQDFANECSIIADVTLSEAGTGSLAVLPSTSSVADIVAGQVLSGTWPPALQPLDAKTFQADRASNNATSLLLMDVPCDARFLVAVAAQDTVDNANTDLSTVSVQTPDVVPPVFLASTPALAASSSTAVWLGVQLDEAGNAAAQVRQSALSRAGASC